MIRGPLERKELIAPFKEGDRVEMVRMAADDPDPIPPGTLGTVEGQSDVSDLARRPEVQIWVKWDNGRTLSPLWPRDTIRKVS